MTLGAALGIATAPPVALTYPHPAVQHACRCGARVPLAVTP
jgi:hypothetical protein